MNKWITYFKSSIGRKKIVGLTGLALCGFVLTHMAGNMLLFVSPEAYNTYSHKLVTNPFIYVAEVGLIVLFLVHLGLAIQLSLENKKARPKGYKASMSGPQSASLASKIAIHTGSIILIFVIYHLITFKFGPEYKVTYGGVEMRDLHRLIIEVFQQPAYVVGYSVAMILLWFHLSHGFASSWQSLGIDQPISRLSWTKIGHLFAALVAGGFLLQPLYVFFAGGK